MEAIYLLIPLAALIVAIIVAGFLWAVRSGQFDDLEGPAHSILMDDDDQVPTKPSADPEVSSTTIDEDSETGVRRPQVPCAGVGSPNRSSKSTSDTDRI